MCVRARARSFIRPSRSKEQSVYPFMNDMPVISGLAAQDNSSNTFVSHLLFALGRTVVVTVSILSISLPHLRPCLCGEFQSISRDHYDFPRNHAVLLSTKGLHSAPSFRCCEDKWRNSYLEISSNTVHPDNGHNVGSVRNVQTFRRVRW